MKEEGKVMGTNGSTNSVAVLMDALAVLHDTRGSVCGVLALVDSAIQVSVASDPNLQAADDLLEKALGMEDATDKDAQICRAKQQVEQVLQCKLGDTSLMAIRAMLVPFQRRLEEQIHCCQQLVEKATGIRKNRSPMERGKKTIRESGVAA